MEQSREVGKISDFDHVVVHTTDQDLNGGSAEFGFRPDWPAIAEELTKRPLLIALGFSLTAIFALEFYGRKVLKRVEDGITNLLPRS